MAAGLARKEALALDLDKFPESQVCDAVLGNVGTVISFQLGVVDVEARFLEQ